MGHGDLRLQAQDERARAVRRLNEVLTERRQLRKRQTTAKGASGEIGAAVLLRAADEQVAARERWLKWVDEQGD